MVEMLGTLSGGRSVGKTTCLGRHCEVTRQANLSKSIRIRPCALEQSAAAEDKTLPVRQTPQYCEHLNFDKVIGVEILDIFGTDQAPLSIFHVEVSWTSTTRDTILRAAHMKPGLCALGQALKLHCGCIVPLTLLDLRVLHLGWMLCFAIRPLVIVGRCE